MATSLPRRRRISSSLSLRRSVPSSRISPLTMALVLRCRPRMAELETDLPEPDSPTIPRVLPFSRLNERPSVALTTPSTVGKWTLRSRTDRKLDNEFPSADAHARVDDGIEHVDDDVGDDDERTEEDDQADDRRQVVGEVRIEGELAEPIVVEHRLGDDR